MSNVVTIFDPSPGSANLGDQIIVESCVREISRIAPETFFFMVSLHQPITKKIRARIAQSDLTVVAGSNMLNTRFNHQPSLTRWRFSLRDSLDINEIILMGVGWNRATDWINPVGSYILRRGLSARSLHSVRDQLTLEKASRIGIGNVLNTSCPTLWRIGRQADSPVVPKSIGKAAVAALTFNERAPQQDRYMLEFLAKRFVKVFFWPQGIGDLKYFQSLNPTGDFEVLPGTLAAYDALLEESGEIVYVGTRLHGGVRALQKRRLALVISVDHRAPGIARSAGISTLSRNDIESLPKAMEQLKYPEITLPEESIWQWQEGIRHRLSKRMGI